MKFALVQAWESNPLLIPQLEALVLPTTVERATQKPTLVCINTPWSTPYKIRCTDKDRYYIPMNIYRCFILDCS